MESRGQKRSLSPPGAWSAGIKPGARDRQRHNEKPANPMSIGIFGLPIISIDQAGAAEVFSKRPMTYTLIYL